MVRTPRGERVVEAGGEGRGLAAQQGKVLDHPGAGLRRQGQAQGLGPGVRIGGDRVVVEGQERCERRIGRHAGELHK
jgi:hypothetical protein